MALCLSLSLWAELCRSCNGESKGVDFPIAEVSTFSDFEAKCYITFQMFDEITDRVRICC